MRQALRIHPDALCSAVTHVEAEVRRPSGGSLSLYYFVTGGIGDLRMPPAVAAPRTDELWRHTCFEAFVRTSPRSAYYEFNLAPSTQWAAYRFSSYRSGMRVATVISVPRVEVQSSPACFGLQAALGLDHISSLPSDAVWRIGLAAVSKRRAAINHIGRRRIHQATRTSIIPIALR
jgi:hypothetical protein